MSDIRVGRVIRAVRVQARQRQADLAARAGCVQSVVSDIERGRLSEVSLVTLRRVCNALEVDLVIDARWRGGTIDRLLDRSHARLVEYTAQVLVDAGWVVEPELSFNEYGDRGSVDLVGWHEAQRALLLVEVKTSLTDLQAMLMSMSRKVRVVPGIVARDRGWTRRRLGRLLVVAGTTANRAVVAHHRVMFESAFPQRSLEARAWLHEPNRDLAGLWFVSGIAVRDRKTSSRATGRATPARTDAT